jgi:hypothetical protein
METDEIQIEGLVYEMRRDAASTRVKDLFTRWLLTHRGLELRLHPYGFAHSIIWTGSDGEALRLHVWVDNSPSRVLPTRAHRHAWNSKSYILLGELTNERYTVHFNPAGEFRLFAIAYKTQTSIRVPTDKRVDCRLVDSQHYSSGDRYAVSVGEYHKTLVLPSSFTATLFLTDQPTSQPLVVGLADEEDEYAFERATIGSSHAQHVIGILVDKLTSPAREITS